MRWVNETLVCTECGAESSATADGWRALLGTNDDDTEEVVVLCPTCYDAEFGDEE